MKKFLSLKRTVATLTPLLLSFPLIAINTNLSYATSLTVSARISEATCAIQVNSGSTGVADLGEWVYSKLGLNISILPVLSSGSAYSAASSTISIDPNCPTLGLALLTMKFPASSASNAENLTTALRYGVTTTTGPTFLLTSQDGNHAFPVWVDIAAGSTAYGGRTLLECVTAPLGLEYSLNNGYVINFADSNNYTYTAPNVVRERSSASAFTFFPLPAGGKSVTATASTTNPGGSNFSAVVPLASGQTVACQNGRAGDNTAVSWHADAKKQLANNTSYKLRFTGPRQIPVNGWADPTPAPGTEFNGTIILSMSYH